MCICAWNFIVASTFAAAVPFGAIAETVNYNGLCEASAAAALDTTHFVVGSDGTKFGDEDEDAIHDFMIYERGRSEPVALVPIDINVNDIEAAVRIGDMIFWLTSHSWTRRDESSSHKDKPERRWLFSTHVDGSALGNVEGSFGGLRQQIAAALKTSEEELAPQLDIEGLSATREGQLLLGLRAPLTEQTTGMAYVVQIANPLAGDGAANDPIVTRLNLDSRGIRSLDRVGDRYLIIAGRSTRESVPDRDPKLFWWDGTTTNGEGRVEPGPVMSLADLGGAAPEAAVVWSGTDIQVLGDNGPRSTGGCNDEEVANDERTFPAIDLHL